jgi:hypothetical protein
VKFIPGFTADGALAFPFPIMESSVAIKAVAAPLAVRVIADNRMRRWIRVGFATSLTLAVTDRIPLVRPLIRIGVPGDSTALADALIRIFPPLVDEAGHNIPSMSNSQVYIGNSGKATKSVEIFMKDGLGTIVPNPPLSSILAYYYPQEKHCPHGR